MAQTAGAHSVDAMLQSTPDLAARPVIQTAELSKRYGTTLATGALALLSLVAAVLAWTGAHAAGANLRITSLMLAATNCFAVAALFLGLGALAYALAARAATSIAYALVAISFLWQLFGPVLGAPRWLLDLSPFAHLGLAPAHAFRLGP
jgi:ABC-2 type transport system permease protein